MNTPKNVINNEQLFVKWLTLWHGDHDAQHEHSECEVYSTLNKYNKGEATIHELFNAVEETEGEDWKESFEHLLQ
jgi:hypothetical protein